MSIFLRLSDRYELALATFDPLGGEPLFALLDPWPNKDRTASPRWFRIFSWLMLIYGPAWLFCAIDSTTCGVDLMGTLKDGVNQHDGILQDIGFYGMFLYAALLFLLIPIARRLLGALINELVIMGIADSSLRKFSPRSTASSSPLRFLEWATRVNWPRALFWLLIFEVINIASYRSMVSDNICRWNHTEKQAHTFFFFLRVGSGQPNLAGLWASIVFFPIIAYLLLTVARIIVLFACLCSELARAKSLRIVPAHPDGTGGLKPIGEVALFHTLFFFAVGLDLMAITANELVIRSNAQHSSSMLLPTLALWGFYLVVGSMLFFLPLLPLRARMAEAKRHFLLESLALKLSAEQGFETEMKEKVFKPDVLQGLVALDLQIQSAGEMAIWPFDRKTFIRYAGLFISPLAPFVIDHFPDALSYLKTWAANASR